MVLRCFKVALIALLCFVLYILIGALIPFFRHPKITPETAKAIASMEFYGNADSGERAAVLVENETALAERIRLISHAQERIILSTFEFRSDTAGRQMLAALLDAAERGVCVQILADDMPAFLRMERNPYFYALSAHPNAEIRLYNPVRPWFPWTLMGRMHDKYLIADQTAYILGGRNTYDYFLGGQEGHKNHDWDVLVYCQSNGASMKQVEAYFYSVWNSGVCRSFHKHPVLMKQENVHRARADLRQIYEGMQKLHPEWFAAVDYIGITVPTVRIQLLCNPISLYAKEPVVCYGMTELLSRGNEIFLHTPYVICNAWMMNRLKGLCRRADSVTLLTNSVSNNGNSFGAMDYQAHKKELLDAGIYLLEYDSGISYHGKCAAMDNRITMVGSFNFDMRSAYIDTELMLVIDSSQFHRIMRRSMRQYELKALAVIDETTC